MKDQTKTKQALIRELTSLRQRVAELEQSDSERQRVEEAFNKSETKYRKLHESMMDGFAIVGMDGIIKEYNKAFMEMLGYTKEEITKLTYRISHRKNGIPSSRTLLTGSFNHWIL